MQNAISNIKRQTKNCNICNNKELNNDNQNEKNALKLNSFYNFIGLNKRF